MDLQQRASILKGYETECYSVCFHLLQCETKATEAAKKALFDIIQYDEFFQYTDQIRFELIRKASAKAAIALFTVWKDFKNERKD